MDTRVFQRVTHHTPHTTPDTHTPHHNTRHNIPQNTTTTRPQHLTKTETETDRDRERDRERRRRQRREERREKREETRKKRENSFSVWWCMAVFSFCSALSCSSGQTRPSLAQKGQVKLFFHFFQCILASQQFFIICDLNFLWLHNASKVDSSSSMYVFYDSSLTRRRCFAALSSTSTLH